MNDPSRDLDRLQTSEQVAPLTRTAAARSSTDSPRHGPLVDHVFEKLGWDADAFAGYRTRVDYPVYGTQVTMAFPAPVADGPTDAK